MVCPEPAILAIVAPIKSHYCKDLLVERRDEDVQPEVELVAVQQQGVTDVPLQHHLPLYGGRSEQNRMCCGACCVTINRLDAHQLLFEAPPFELL